MDQETVASLRAAHESSIMLITLLLEGNQEAAADLVYECPKELAGSTAMATAMIAIGAIRTLAKLLEVDPMEFIQIAGLNAAQLVIEYENDEGNSS